MKNKEDHLVSIILRKESTEEFTRQLLISSMSEEDAISLFGKLFALAIEEHPPEENDKLIALKMKIIDLDFDDFQELKQWIRLDIEDK